MSVGITAKGIWYAQYRVPGKKSPRKEYFGKGEAAKQQAKERDHEVKRQKLLGIQEEPEPIKVHLAYIGQKFVDHLRRKERSKRHIDRVKYLLNKHWTPVLRDKPVEEFCYEDFDTLYDTYAGQSENTKLLAFTMLNAVFNYGVKRELIVKNPMKLWMEENPLRQSRRKLLLNLEDLGKIAAEAEPHLRFAIQMMWETGARPGQTELYKLKWDDVDWENKTIHVRGTKTETSDRHVSVSDHCIELLREKQKEAQTEYIIENNGERIKYPLHKQLKREAKKAGITYSVCMYQIRHLYTSEMLRKGADMRAVASLLGHKTLKMVLEVYYHEMHGEKARAVACKPELVIG